MIFPSCRCPAVRPSRTTSRGQNSANLARPFPFRPLPPVPRDVPGVDPTLAGVDGVPPSAPFFFFPADAVPFPLEEALTMTEVGVDGSPSARADADACNNSNAFNRSFIALYLGI